MSPRHRVAAQPSSLNRNIHFYRADAGTDESGKPVPLDVDGVLEAVHDLPFTPRNQGGRYLSQAGGEDLCAWVDATARPQRLRLARLRRNAFPQAEIAGALSEVQLAAGASLYEAIHLLFLANNVIGAEFNFYGPRPSRLPGYLNSVIGNLPAPFVMEQILRQDAADQLDRQRGLRLVDLQVRPTYAASVAEADAGLGAALDATARVGSASVIGVILKAEPRTRRERLSDDILNGVRRLARRNDLRDNAHRFKVRGVGPEGRVEPIDLLSDALVSVEQVTRAGATSRAVEPESAYQAVAAAYAKLNQEGLLDGPSASTVQS